MKILNRYLFRCLLFPLLYCLLGFTLIFIISDLFDNFSDFLESGIGFLDILYYYSLILPPVIVLIIPACLLLAVLYSLSQLTRHSEIIAMRAGGVSIYRIVMPFIGAGIIASLVTAVINEKIAPDSAYRAEQFLDYQKSGRDAATFFARNIALKDRNHVWMIGRIDTRDHSMYSIELIIQREDGSDAEKIQAEKAMWMDGRWWFAGITVQHYRANGDLLGAPEMISHREMRELHETPATFMAEIKDPQFLSSQEMITYLNTKEITGNTRTRMKVDLHARMSTPLICIIVTLLGVPVGTHTGRRGALAGIMTAMGFFFGFYLLQLVAQSLGKQELIPAWLGGWLPVLVYFIIGPVLIYRMR